MSTSIKIVPDSAPNADGEWITVPVDIPANRPRPWLWRDEAAIVEPFVPEGFHVVSIIPTRVPCLK